MDVRVGFTVEQVRELIDAAMKGADEKVARASRLLGIAQGAMRTMPSTVRQADVPDERLSGKMAEIFEQSRKAAVALATLRPDGDES